MSKNANGIGWFMALMTIPIYASAYMILDRLDQNHELPRLQFLIYFILLSFLIKVIIVILHLIAHEL